MNRKSSSRQLALFLAELPTWESLPHDRQQALQEMLSLLLEQALSQQTCLLGHNPQERTAEKHHV
jgi:hypothetical protein